MTEAQLAYIITGLLYGGIIFGAIRFLKWLDNREERKKRADLANFQKTVGGILSYDNGVCDVLDYVVECAETARKQGAPDSVVKALHGLAKAINREFPLKSREDDEGTV